MIVLVFFFLPESVALVFFFFQAEDGIRDLYVTGVQTCALPISAPAAVAPAKPEDGRIIIPNGKQPLKLPAPAAPNPDAQPQSDQGQPPPQPEPAQLLNVPGQP